MSLMSLIRGDDIKAAVDSAMPKSEPWRSVVDRLHELGITEAHMPVTGSPVEPWLEKLRGWIMELAAKAPPPA